MPSNQEHLTPGGVLDEPDYDADMALPMGRTCEDCASSKRCFGLGFSQPGSQSCDFWPSRYRPVSALRAAAELSSEGEG